mmetsp:Transcript_93492/g.264708  ORF Transcript_93492/g.264708 Transcript_93492/m.264708 type:complete len:273 (-) Transcript_93492:375-1193(-)
MISHRASRFSGDLVSSFVSDGRPTSVISCWVSGGSFSRIRSPSRLKKNTALSKMRLDSEKSVSAGKNRVQTFQNSGGDFVSVSTSSWARFASVSKTRTDVSSTSRIFCSSGGGAARLKSLPPPSVTPSRHCSMKETTMSLRVSTILVSSSDSWMMLETSGRMMSAAGFTKSAGCCMVARAPTEVRGAPTALSSWVLLPETICCCSPLSALPRSWIVGSVMACTLTSSMRMDSVCSSLLEASRSAFWLPCRSRRSCLMSSGASVAFCTRRSSW